MYSLISAFYAAERRGIDPPGIKVFIMTLFELAYAYTLDNQKDLAIKYYELVHNNTKMLLENTPSERRMMNYGPLNYSLLSLNNIIVFYLNLGDFNKIIEVGNELIEILSIATNNEFSSLPFQQFLSKYDDETGEVISLQISKYLRNRFFAYLALDRAKEANGVYTEFLEKFGNSSIPEIVRRLDEIQEAREGVDLEFM